MLGKACEARAAYLAAQKRGEPDAKTLRMLVQRDFEEASRSAAPQRSAAHAVAHTRSVTRCRMCAYVVTRCNS